MPPLPSSPSILYWLIRLARGDVAAPMGAGDISLSHARTHAVAGAKREHSHFRAAFGVVPAGSPGASSRRHAGQVSRAPGEAAAPSNRKEQYGQVTSMASPGSSLPTSARAYHSLVACSRAGTWPTGGSRPGGSAATPPAHRAGRDAGRRRARSWPRGSAGDPAVGGGRRHRRRRRTARVDRHQKWITAGLACYPDRDPALLRALLHRLKVEKQSRVIATLIRAVGAQGDAVPTSTASGTYVSPWTPRWWR
jgi:hypothetical protein